MENPRILVPTDLSNLSPGSTAANVLCMVKTAALSIYPGMGQAIGKEHVEH